MSTCGCECAILMSTNVRFVKIRFTPNFCQAPIDDVGSSEFAGQDICRFDISVYDPSGISMGERLTNLNQDIDQDVEREGALGLGGFRFKRLYNFS